MLPAMALLPGSLYALISAVVADFLIVIRTCPEDAALQKELPGYADYTRKVRFRLIPSLW